MEWSYYAESVWRYSVPLEVVPDVAAWLFCSMLALLLARFVIFRRPIACTLSLLAWLAWLGTQVYVNGMQALYSAKRRGLAAMEASDHFAQHLLALVKAWTDFFLPFLSDVCKWSLRIYKKMSVRQRLIVCFTALSAFVIYQAVWVVRRHKKNIVQVLFHLSFLVGGPLVWYSSGLLPLHVLELVVTHVITTLPAVISLLVISGAPEKGGRGVSPPSSRKKPPNSGGFFRGRSEATPGNEPSGNTRMHRLWLSYWSCWPALAVLEAGVRMAPTLAQLENSENLQMELQRALLTFVVWLQFWQGSWLLHYTINSMMFNTSFLEYLARFFGARGLWVLSIIRGGVWAGVSPTGGWRMFSLLKVFASRAWLAGLGLALLLGVGVVLVTLFYRAVSVVSGVATMMLWLCAASDSADTLTNDAEEFYTKKLSFWVLAMFWEACTNLPYGFGLIVRLVTPFAFSLWLLAGDTVLRRLVLPTVRLVVMPVVMLWLAIFGRREPQQPRTAHDASPTGRTKASNSVPSEEPRTGASAATDAAGEPCPVSATGGLEDDDSGAIDGDDTGGTGTGLSGLACDDGDDSSAAAAAKSPEKGIRKRAGRG